MILWMSEFKQQKFGGRYFVFVVKRKLKYDKKKTADIFMNFLMRFFIQGKLWFRVLF